MYAVAEKDSVHELRLPQSSVGSPSPAVLATEQGLLLAYWLEEHAWPKDREFSHEACALVRFSGARVHLFGPPNDEAFDGHPLAARGLRPYRAFEVRQSSWIRCIERMNAGHPRHDPARYSRLRHFVFTFHDSTFECVALDFELAIEDGDPVSILRNSISPSP